MNNSNKINLNLDKSQLNDNYIVNERIESVYNKVKMTIEELIHKVAVLTLKYFKLIRQTFSRKKISKPVSSYCFTQQYNDSCHLSPWVNLSLLHQLRENHYIIDQLPTLTRRQWLGENQQMLNAWHGLIRQVSLPEAKERYPNLYNYLHQGIDKAPNTPHYYDKNGEIPFRGLSGFIEFSDLPFFLIDLDRMKQLKFKVFCRNYNFGEMLDDIQLGVSTGIVKDKEGYKVYNHSQKSFDEISSLNWIDVKEMDEKKIVVFHPEFITDEIRKNYQIENIDQTIVMTTSCGLGFEEIGVNEEIWSGIRKVDAEGKTQYYFPFESALLKLMFLAAGVDENNNPIDTVHRLNPLFQEFHELMSKHPSNPWHPDQLSKDKMFQYQIANLFKEDRELFEMAKQLVGTYNSNVWTNYQKVKNSQFYNQQGRSLDPDVTKDYLLGEEQALAYYFVSNVRYMWYSAINPKAFMKALEIGISDRFAKPVHYWAKRKFLKKQKVKIHNETLSLSYMDVWKKICEKMRQKEQKDYVSFDDHGWVITFDEKIIEMQQNSATIYDKKLLNELGFAGIESWMSSELNLWYKTDNNSLRNSLCSVRINPALSYA